jgi:hypothetical protein
MKEEFLHFIWKHCLFENDKLFTSDNRKVEVISPGELNNDAGPDFISARIKMDDVLWAGNVEIHLHSSQWQQHNHHHDKKYNNVILHVVNHIDDITINEKGETVPLLKLPYPGLYLRNYQSLQENINWISCRDKLKKYKPESILLYNWLVNLTVERIEQKITNFRTLLGYTNNNWEEAFYINFARYFGGNVNTTAFEMMAKVTPQKILARHKDSLHQVEAFLFGQAGFLEEDYEDEYFRSLKSEYSFLKNKYHLKHVDNALWSFFRLRPSNFPTIRLAEFAALIHSSSALFSKFIHAEKIGDIETYFNTPVSSYWNSHVKFGKISSVSRSKMGIQSIRSLIINAIIPAMFYYGKTYSKPGYSEKVIEWLEQLPPENNAIIRKWADVEIHAKNALESQALIQLKKLYCEKKKCLNCQLGKKLITAQ